MADIFIGSKDGKQVYQFPWIPENFPEFNRSAKNEVFETFSTGEFNNLGSPGLLEFSLEGKLPMDPSIYSFSKSNVGGYTIINLMARAMANKEPVRLVINRNKNSKTPSNLINILVSVESMSWQELKNSNISYNVSFKEYRYV